ncbi:hypothetical protein JNW90_07545 [Micromonospora sp. STR1s_5]|nr:hypothetical protein [Micromonospora sp. STR1s_5]
MDMLNAVASSDDIPTADFLTDLSSQIESAQDAIDSAEPEEIALADREVEKLIFSLDILHSKLSRLAAAISRSEYRQEELPHPPSVSDQPAQPLSAFDYVTQVRQLAALEQDIANAYARFGEAMDLKHVRIDNVRTRIDDLTTALKQGQQRRALAALARMREQLTSDRHRLGDLVGGSSRHSARARQARDLFGRAIGRAHELSQGILARTTAPTIPAQAPAPVKVRLIGERLSLVSSQTNTGSIGPGAVDRVRKTAAEMLAAIIDELRSSNNVDQRIAPALSALLSHLNAPHDQFSPEGLGMNWSVATRVLARSRDEFPDIAAIQLEEALRSVNVVINQYEEWRTLQAEQLGLEIEPAAVAEIVHEAEQIRETLAAGDYVSCKPAVDPIGL